VNNFFKWLFPGLKVKRWILVIFFGMLLTFLSISMFLGGMFIGKIEEYIISLLIIRGPAMKIVGMIGLIIGAYLMVLGAVKTIRSIISVFIPENENQLVEIIFKNRLLQKGPRIVAIGGGSGLSTVLRGIKEYTTNITAVVTVADDGGSSGRLRKDLGILPPGDIRNCIIALADTESLLETLFQYRFNTGELDGHSFGNLFIAAMTGVLGDFEKAVKESSNVLAIRGRVIPSTLSDINLHCLYKDGEEIKGESLIPKAGKEIERIYLNPGDVPATIEVIEAIKNAEMIVIGPGSLYTSIIPNLLVKDITDGIRKSKAIKVFVVNTMTQFGETTNYKASDHIKAIEKHCGKGIFDYILINTGTGNNELLEKYKKEQSTMVDSDIDVVSKMGYRIVANNLIQRSKDLKHNPDLLAELLMRLIINRGIKRFFKL
jgi:uncharacterized cofD-like protein